MDPVGEGERSMGVASTLDPVNWEGSKRTEMLEEQGISAEVLFPNTVPPFYPSGAISAPGPRSEEEYARRLAGIKAHNRWVADFCGELPGRRAGIAQVFLNNVEDAVEEVRWGKEHGLMGVLLPADHFHGLVNLYYPKFDPLWSVCAELDMPVHRHGIIPSESSNSETGPGAVRCGTARSALLRPTGSSPHDLGWRLRTLPHIEVRGKRVELRVGGRLPPDARWIR